MLKIAEEAGMGFFGKKKWDDETIGVVSLGLIRKMCEIAVRDYAGGGKVEAYVVQALAGDSPRTRRTMTVHVMACSPEMAIRSALLTRHREGEEFIGTMVSAEPANKGRKPVSVLYSSTTQLRSPCLTKFKTFHELQYEHEKRMRNDKS